MPPINAAALGVGDALKLRRRSQVSHLQNRPHSERKIWTAFHRVELKNINPFYLPRSSSIAAIPFAASLNAVAPLKIINFEDRLDYPDDPRTNSSVIQKLHFAL